MNTLAIDLGGSAAKIGLVRDGTIIQRWHVPTDKTNLWHNIARHLETLNWRDVDTIGVAIPGFIKHNSGIVTLSGNFNWHNYDAKSAAESVFNRPVAIINDANAAALGEFWKREMRPHQSMLFYTIGTGIGGGAIIKSALYEGIDGYAGEFGHGGYFQNERACECGLAHCLEPISSATGMTRALHAAGFAIDLKTALARVEQNDLAIRAVLKKALTPLVSHMAIMQTALNPDLIVVGGGPSAQPRPLISIIEEILPTMQLPFIAASTPIQVARTQNDAGIFGAAYWAQTQNKNHKER